MSCAETLDIPVAPDLDDVVVAYASPTAEISEAVMEAVGDELLELRERLEQSQVFEEILDVIVSVQLELDANTDENGNLSVPGLGAFPEPNAVIEITHNCAGWDRNAAEGAAETSGSIRLTMLLDTGDIRPEVWGDATQCEFLAALGATAVQTSYDGEVAVHFGEEPVPTGERLRDLVITFALTGTLRVAGKEVPIDQSFRLRGEGDLEILWELDGGTSFVYLFNLETLRQGIRDANCTGDEGCSCSLEERECTLPSGTIFW
jgi:hypothetical protein